MRHCYGYAFGCVASRSLHSIGDEGEAADPAIGIFVAVLLFVFIAMFCGLWYCLCSLGFPDDEEYETTGEDSPEIPQSISTNGRRVLVETHLKTRTFSSQRPSVVPHAEDITPYTAQELNSVSEAGADTGSFCDQCAICLEPLLDGDLAGVAYDTKCQHLFHRACLVSWLMKHNACPCCRRQYIEPVGNIIHSERTDALSSIDLEMASGSIDAVPPLIPPIPDGSNSIRIDPVSSSDGDETSGFIDNTDSPAISPVPDGNNNTRNDPVSCCDSDATSGSINDAAPPPV